MLRHRKSALALALVAAAAFVSCGGDGSNSAPSQTTSTSQAVSTGPPPVLTAADVAVIDDAKQAVRDYCAKVGLALAGRGPGPSEADYAGTTTALDDLADLAARKPEAETNTPDRSTATLALGDIAENLEGTNCDPRLVDRIDEALASLPGG